MCERHAFNRHVLFFNYFLGYAMQQLAVTYVNLGRHVDAISMFNRTLEFFRRYMPENHSSIGEILDARVVIRLLCRFL